MIQKNTSQTKTAPEMGTKRVTAKISRRRKAYEASTAFKEALVVVQHDLRQATVTHLSEVTEFLSWVRKNGLTVDRRQLRKKLNGIHKDISASLRVYVGFVLRFGVYLEFISRGGERSFEPKYLGLGHSQMKVGVRGGKLVPPSPEPDAEVRDLFASIGGLPAEIRREAKRKRSSVLMSEQSKRADAELMERGLSKEEVAYLRAVQRTRGSNPEDAKLRIVEVDSEDNSSVTQLLDAAYDPLSITFLLVGSRGQTRLMCLVGELVRDDEWKQLGVVRSIMQTVMWGKAPAGAPLKRFAQDLDQVPADGTISMDVVLAATIGDTETDRKRTEKRLQRARERADRVRKQIALL